MLSVKSMLTSALIGFQWCTVRKVYRSQVSTSNPGPFLLHGPSDVPPAFGASLGSNAPSLIGPTQLPILSSASSPGDPDSLKHTSFPLVTYISMEMPLILCMTYNRDCMYILPNAPAQHFSLRIGRQRLNEYFQNQTPQRFTLMMYFIPTSSVFHGACRGSRRPSVGIITPFSGKSPLPYQGHVTKTSPRRTSPPGGRMALLFDQYCPASNSLPNCY